MAISHEGSIACRNYCDTVVYNGHLRGLVSLTPLAKRLAVELALPIFTYDLGLWRLGPQMFRYVLFSNELSFGNEKPIYFNLKLTFFVLSQYRAVHREAIDIV